MDNDWQGCDLVEVVPVACVKGTQIPAAFVVARNEGIPLEEVLEAIDDSTLTAIADYARRER